MSPVTNTTQAALGLRGQSKTKTICDEGEEIKHTGAGISERHVITRNARRSVPGIGHKFRKALMFILS